MKLLAALLVLVVHAACQDMYTDKYDNMDIDQILANKRLTNAYMKCVLGTGKCTPEGRYLKTHITDALQTGCVKCTGNQQYGIRKVIAYLLAHDRPAWDKLVKTYDPKGVYSEKYKQELSSIAA